MEYKEYTNPLSSDYDLRINEESIIEEGPIKNNLSILLVDLIGVHEENDLNIWNITYEEYLNPTPATIKKVLAYMKQNNIPPVDSEGFMIDSDELLNPKSKRK